MKIAIIGNAGSGKSTLSAKLRALLAIPLYHLDQYFWKPGWQEPDRHDDMRWFAVDTLPENMVPAHRHAIEQIQKNSFYSEHGW